MNYEFMGTPFEFEKFEDLSRKEARAYFKWYVGQIDSRMEILKAAVLEENPEVNFDFSPESLIPVWKWYQKKIVFVRKPEETLSKQIDELQGWFAYQFLRAGRKYEDIDMEYCRESARKSIDETEISEETLGYAKDMAIYFSEVLRRNHEDVLYWTFIATAKRHVSFNKPVLMGFVSRVSLDASMVIRTLTSREQENKNENALFQAYNNWLNNLPENWVNYSPD